MALATAALNGKWLNITHTQRCRSALWSALALFTFPFSFMDLFISLTVFLTLSFSPSLSISHSHCYVVCSFSHAHVASLFGRGSLCAAWIGGSDPIHRQLSVGNWNACALCWGRRQLPNRKKLLKSDRKIKSNKYVR